MSLIKIRIQFNDLNTHVLVDYHVSLFLIPSVYQEFRYIILFYLSSDSHNVFTVFKIYTDCLNFNGVSMQIKVNSNNISNK